jgi:hypothetical protein
MSKLRIIAGLALAVLLGACSGNTLSGSTTTTGGSNVAKVTVTASPASIAVDGSSSTTITATALDANNAGVSGQTVSFGSSTGGVIGAVSGTTNTSGVATATLTNSSAAAGSNLTVTAKVGTVSGTVTVGVVAIQQTITLTTSLPQLPSDGSKSAVITAYVKNASNQFVVGVPVNFTADSGGLAITQGTTGANGAATATLETGSGNPANRTITVTATAGSSTATLQVAVVGTTLSVVGPANLVINGQGTYTVSLLNSSSVGIPNQTVTLKSTNGNTLSTTSFVTDSTGQKTVTLTAVNAGADTLQASALGLTAGQGITVSGQNFAFSTPATQGTKVDLGVAQTLTVTWLSNNAPQANQTVNFASTRGTLSATSATTNAQGQATVSIMSSDAGSATVTASAAAVTTQTTLDFIATNPASIALEASPATIATHGQSTITAVVRDAQDNLVEGQAVNFSTVGDTTGGTLSSASGTTDAQGRAQTVYTASSTPSATNGVVIQASIPGNAAVTQTTDLTVGGLSVGLSLGTGALITEINNAAGLPVQFSVPYTVIAVDSAGNPVPNVPVTITVHALNYYKGTYVVVGSSWMQTGLAGAISGTPSAYAQCKNEDDSEPDVNNAPNPSDFNGVLDPGEDGCTNGVPNSTGPFPTPNTDNLTCNAQGNGNGKLDPGVTAVAVPASGNTDSTGTLNFSINYPESDALWVDVQLIASTNVSGTESSASVSFRLPILAKYLTTTTASPPGYPSPFGTNAQCNVAN